MAVECAKPQLMLFEPKPVQYSILKTDTVCLKPISSIENSPVIQFADHGYSDRYKNLESIYVVLKVQMQHFKDDGKEITTKIEAKDLNVYPVNNTLHSLFKQINLQLNGKQIGQNTQNYAYRAYIENCLNYSLDAANNHLDTIIFKPDTAGKFDSTDGTNLGAVKRALLFQPGEAVELVGRLHLDMLNCNKLLLNNIDIGLTFETNKEDFYLIKKDKSNKSHLKILDMSVYLDHVQLNPEVSLSHEKILASGKNAVYNYKRCEFRNYLVSSGLSSFAWDHVTNGHLPDFIIFFMVDGNSYNGDITKNPFNLKSNNLDSWIVSINGIETAPRNLSFSMDQSNPLSQHAYFSLFKQLNLHKFDKANIIDRELFNNGAFMLAYDLTPDRDTDCSNFVNSGVVRVEGKFKSTLSEPITILAYMQFDSDLVIDKDRNVYPSYM